jgi:hypothetical protein
MASVSIELFAYPWDIVDEGPVPFLDRCLELGVNRVHVAASYHSGKFLLPRNKRAKVYFPEPGALYFQPPRHLWNGGLEQPVSSLAGTGWLEDLAEYAARNPISLFAWTVFFHNSTLGARYPQLTAQNAFGDHYPFALCPSHSEVRDHGLALCRSLGSLGLFSGIDLETIGYLGYLHGHHHEVTAVPLGAAEKFLLSLCFCSACCTAGEAAGIRMESLASEVRRILLIRMQHDDAPGSPDDNCEQLAALLITCPAILALIRVRIETITGLVKRISAERGAMHLAAFTSSFVGSPSNIWMEGISPAGLKDMLECFHLLAYAPQALDVNPDLVFFLTMLEDADRINLTLNLGLPITRTFDQAAAKVAYARRQGVRRFSFFNYGFLGPGRLRWIRDLAILARETGE